MHTIVNLNFNSTRMWSPTEPTIEEEDHLFSFIHMAEALYKVDKSQICVEPQPLESCLKTANINTELQCCPLVTAICNTFSCQEFSHKTLTELPKHVHFRLISDDPIHVKRPSSF